MVQVLSPVNPLAHKPRPSSFRCSPITRRRTLPSPRDLSFSQAKYQNAIERAAVRKLTAQIVACAQHSSLSKLEHPNTTVLAAPFASSVSALAPINPAPAAPLELENSRPDIKPKVDIFKNTTKSDELLGVYGKRIWVHCFLTFIGAIDLTLAALHRIYIEDFAQDSGPFQPQTMSQASFNVVEPGGRAYKHCYDQSPPSTCGSSVSSASSTPCALPTPPSSPGLEPEIAYPGEVGTNKLGGCHTTLHSKVQPVTRTQSLPGNFQYRASSGRNTTAHPVLEDKFSLRWFLTELLRRSRASASVVQLALHYLAEARIPVGKILAGKFKSESVSTDLKEDQGKSMDSPLLDPRKLLLAALMLSTKMLHDHAPNNRAWARVCGLDARDVNACERALGQALNWELAHMFVGPLDESAMIE
ncbi:hypothetical protein CTheo_1998 [Ceratobasidium theobromae]|uniref:Cyclin N-terminal domain-containing protein n=1 Tax=Ceratobasidium theobromae TaxID=1582974 RepID=A0A5N5QS03_9AGAM|nr:hypothetical protein CTheo_1998 [Ceratobasidium theobromae]